MVNLTACITGGNQQSEAFHEKLGYRKVADFAHVGYVQSMARCDLDAKELQWFPEKVPAFIPNEKA